MTELEILLKKMNKTIIHSLKGESGKKRTRHSIKIVFTTNICVYNGYTDLDDMVSSLHHLLPFLKR